MANGTGGTPHIEKVVSPRPGNLIAPGDEILFEGSNLALVEKVNVYYEKGMKPLGNPLPATSEGIDSEARTNRPEEDGIDGHHAVVLECVTDQGVKSNLFKGMAYVGK
ncbi:hypothetical protein [Streptomyces sp. NPDC015350]|uniref:hypothetical protein n=1 Tax=Streptomyces sp. NPDC015350 TaxID=3364955 RepID=UPI0036FE9374